MTEIDEIERGGHRVNETEKARLEVLVQAIWLNGFWCNRCNDRFDRPWLKKQSRQDRVGGWRAVCPECGSEISICDDRINSIMRAGMPAVSAVACVCFVYRVSLLNILTKDRTVRNLSKVTGALIRELQGVMLDSEIMKALSVDARTLREARENRASSPIWTTAVEHREEARRKYERRKQKRERSKSGKCNTQKEETVEGS